jgi:hypothetical protein
MSRHLLFVLLLATGVVLAGEAPETKRAGAAAEARATSTEDPKSEDPKKEDPHLGMSILGNQEAPKSLVIVPWKSSQLGAALGISPMLDDSRQPIDKEVFMRALSYYEVRSKKKP